MGFDNNRTKGIPMVGFDKFCLVGYVVYELPLWYLQTFLAAGRQTAINQSAIRNQQYIL
jgi:hypothetical protein